MRIRILTLLAVCLLAAPARATVLVPASLEELTRDADRSARRSMPPGWNLAALLLAGIALLACGTSILRAADSTEPLSVGVAQVDITPDYPIRLNGFGGRRTESEGVTRKIWAKALAFGDAQLGPAVIITTDNLGVTDEITQVIAERLAAKTGLKPKSANEGTYS